MAKFTEGDSILIAVDPKVPEELRGKTGTVRGLAMDPGRGVTSDKNSVENTQDPVYIVVFAGTSWPQQVNESWVA